MKKYYKSIGMLMFLSVVASNVLASGWATGNKSAKIDFINAEVTLVRVGYTATDKANPDDCINFDSLILKKDHPLFDQHFAILLTAFMGEKPVRVYVSGCMSAWSSSFPIITAIYIDK